MSLGYTGTNTQVALARPAHLLNLPATGSATIMVWARVGVSAQPVRNFFNKGFWAFQASGSGQLLIRADCSGGNAVVARSSDTTIIPSTPPSDWQFFAGNINVNNPQGQQGKLYTGSLTSAAVQIPTSSTSTSSPTQYIGDANQNTFIFNNPFTNSAPTGSIAFVHIVNRELDVNEIRSLQFSPRIVSGTVLFCHLGFSGTSNIYDLSGYRTTGSISNAVIMPHVPIMIR